MAAGSHSRPTCREMGGGGFKARSRLWCELACEQLSGERPSMVAAISIPAPLLAGGVAPRLCLPVGVAAEIVAAEPSLGVVVHGLVVRVWPQPRPVLTRDPVLRCADLSPVVRAVGKGVALTCEAADVKCKPRGGCKWRWRHRSRGSSRSRPSRTLRKWKVVVLALPQKQHYKPKTSKILRKLHQRIFRKLFLVYTCIITQK